ncbi:MAG: alpha/beta hydrolase [Oscillospiraceae bacterium]|nr:alpha/beta hydrolase [Oscillospiraceae bacterium]
MAELYFQGKKVYYEVHGDTGETLVLLNGIMMSTASWLPFVECLSKTNRLILVDFLDQGQSERIEAGYDHSIQVEVLEAVLAELSGKLSCEKYNIMGISYGGEVAIQYALAYPNRVRRLILANTCARTSGWLKKIGDGWNEVAKCGSGLAYYLTTIPIIYSTRFFEERAEWMEGREKMLTEYFARADVREALIRLTDSSREYDVSDRLGEIKCPTLVISSSEDALVPMTEQKLIHERIKGSSYVTINGSGHASMYEVPEAFAALTAGFANLPDNCIKI